MSSSTQQLERMLTLVPYLQTNAEGVPIAALAERFKVSKKQIKNELIALAMTGTRPNHAEMIDIDWDRLEDGLAIIENADFMARPLRLTVIEGSALVAALSVLQQMAEYRQAEIIDQVTAKIHSALSAEHDPGITVHVDIPNSRTRHDLEYAMKHGLQVKIRYVSDHSDSESERIIDPYTLTFERGFFYLTAWCHLAEGQRIFRLDRVKELTILASPVASRELASPEGLFNFSAHGSEALLEVDPVARWIVEPCQTEVVTEADDGMRHVKVHAFDEQWLLRLIMLGGGAIRVIEPTALRQRLTDEAVLALDAYTGT